MTARDIINKLLLIPDIDKEVKVGVNINDDEIHLNALTVEEIKDYILIGT